MHWMKALALLTAVSILAAPVPTYANMTTAATAQDYAAREAQAADLEGFTGGSVEGVIVAVLVIAFLVWLVIEVVEPAVEHHHQHHHPGPVNP